MRSMAGRTDAVHAQSSQQERENESQMELEHRSWPLHWRSSVPVGLRTSRATHLVEHCGEWPPPVPLRRSAVRDATEHAAAAPFSASRSSECREQPCAAARWSPSLETSPNTRAGASFGSDVCCCCCCCCLSLVACLLLSGRDNNDRQETDRQTICSCLLLFAIIFYVVLQYVMGQFDMVWYCMA